MYPVKKDINALDNNLLSIGGVSKSEEKNDDSSNNESIKDFILNKKLYLILGLLLLVIIIVVIILLTKGNKTDDNIKTKYEFGLNITELEKRVSKEYLVPKILLKKDAPEYLNLSDGDKEALKYLVKAGSILENVHLQIDDHHNLPFKSFLEEEIKKNNTQAKLTKILFDAQKGINAVDFLSNKINLIKGIEKKPGIGVYPENLTETEFHNILIKMIKENKIKEVKEILNQRSIVIRDGEYLKAIDYVEYFKDDFNKIADELVKASKVSTNKDFNEYLILQAKALRTADPMLDAEADKKWATLQNCPLELTLTRENYEDELTGTFIENKELEQLLIQNNITAIPKDSLGLRVGIINQQGTNALISIKQYLPDLAKEMPYNTEYEQKILDDKESKQTMVDVDLIMLAGDTGTYRGGITLAENLPNDDKLSLTIGGGRRNVYHRQIRFVTDMEKVKQYLNAILVDEQHKYYFNEASHWFTIGHENTHSLGPNTSNSKLGKYSHILEENKADMGGLAFLDFLTEKNYYNEEKKKQIIVTSVLDFFLKSKPNLNQAHRVRTVMQNYYFFKGGCYQIKDGKIFVVIDKVVECAYNMLSEIVRIQIDNDFEKAEKFVNNNFNWTDEMQLIGEKLQNVSISLNGRLENELADKLLEDY